jgi:hypothetical protein
MIKEQIEQLLLPRYKLIADYPGSPFCDVLQPVLSVEEILSEDYSMKSEEDINKYPHIFRPLQWWEQRTEEEMPKYIRIKDRVWQVEWKEWLGECRPTAPLDFTRNRPKGYEPFSHYWHFDKNISLPITEAEFLHQQTQNNG